LKLVTASAKHEAGGSRNYCTDTA